MPTLQESWLHGEIKHIIEIFCPVDRARHYFKNWTEEDVREFWQDFEIILDEFILSPAGSKSASKNKVITITRNLFMLEMMESFQLFLNKWEEKYKKISPQLIQRPHKKTTFYLPVYLHRVLGSAFILSRAVQEDYDAVGDMYSLLGRDETDEIRSILNNEQAITKHCQKIARQPRRCTLNLLIEKILTENRALKSKDIWRTLESYAGKEISLREIKPRIIIKEISENNITFIKKDGEEDHASYSTFSRRIAYIRKNLQ